MNWLQKWALSFVALGLQALKIILNENPAAIKKYKGACKLIMELSQIIAVSNVDIMED